MLASNKIKREILLAAAKDPELNFGLPLDTDEEVEAAYGELIRTNYHWDYESGFREGDCETDIPCDYSRHYETRSVAMKCSDGSWVGWTYWYGGGKHGCPEEIDWISEAYDLSCTEEWKTVLVRTFEVVN